MKPSKLKGISIWHQAKRPLLFQSSRTWQNSWPGNGEAIRIHSHVRHELHVLLKTEMPKRHVDHPSRGNQHRHAVQICTHATLKVKAKCYLETVVLINCNIRIAEVRDLAYRIKMKNKKTHFAFSFLQSQADTLCIGLSLTVTASLKSEQMPTDCPCWVQPTVFRLDKLMCRLKTYSFCWCPQSQGHRWEMYSLDWCRWSISPRTSTIAVLHYASNFSKRKNAWYGTGGQATTGYKCGGVNGRSGTLFFRNGTVILYVQVELPGRVAMANVDVYP